MATCSLVGVAQSTSPLPAATKSYSKTPESYPISAGSTSICFVAIGRGKARSAPSFPPPTLHSLTRTCTPAAVQQKLQKDVIRRDVNV